MAEDGPAGRPGPALHSLPGLPAGAEPVAAAPSPGVAQVPAGRSQEQEPSRLERGLRWVLRDIARFSQYVVGRPLRPYQLEPARAILDSILHRRGRTFTVMMSRQAGKNELSAHLEAYLLTLHQRRGGSIVKAAPTYQPQVLNSILRLEQALDTDLSRGRWSLRMGVLQLGKARCQFFSGEPQSHVVGATASLLLEVDEAQDFDEQKYLKDFRPMAASANATTVLYGTAWTADTLLERVRAENQRLEAADGVRRNFTYPWAVVAEANPDYGRFVRAEIERLGETHPLVRTQYLLEPLSSGGRFLSELQLAQLAAPPSAAAQADSTAIYVAGIDVAGEEEDPGGLDPDAAVRALHPGRDSTAVAIGRVVWADQLGVAEPHIQIVRFEWWTGRKHRDVLPQLVDLLRSAWPCVSVTVDATGVGAGLASFLVGALGPQIVHPFTFTAVSKSDLGYQLLAAINGGRLRVGGGGSGGHGQADAFAEFWRQARLARSSLHANQRLSFSVDPREGHDDLLMAVALAVEAAQHSRPQTAVGRLTRRAE